MSTDDIAIDDPAGFQSTVDILTALKGRCESTSPLLEEATTAVNTWAAGNSQKPSVQAFSVAVQAFSYASQAAKASAPQADAAIQNAATGLKAALQDFQAIQQSGAAAVGQATDTPEKR